MPTSNNYAYTIAVCGTLSFAMVILSFFSAALFGRGDFAKQLRRKIWSWTHAPDDRVIPKTIVFVPSKETKAADFMISYLLWVCLFQSVCSQMSYFWVDQSLPAILPSKNITYDTLKGLCWAQGLGLTIANITSAFASLAICLITVQTLFGFRDEQSKESALFEKIFFAALLFILPVGITALILFNENEKSGPIFGSIGAVGGDAWCTISENYLSQRFYNHYLWILMVTGLLYLGYGFIIIKILRHSAKQGERLGKGVITKLIWYPVIHSALYSFISVDISLRAVSPSYNYKSSSIAFGYTIVMLDGFFKSLVYLQRRQVVRRFAILFGILKESQASYLKAKNASKQSLALSVKSIRSEAKGSVGNILEAADDNDDFDDVEEVRPAKKDVLLDFLIQQGGGASKPQNMRDQAYTTEEVRPAKKDDLLDFLIQQGGGASKAHQELSPDNEQPVTKEGMDDKAQENDADKITAIPPKNLKPRNNDLVDFLGRSD